MDKKKILFLLFKNNLEISAENAKIKIFNKSLKIDPWFIGKVCLIYNGKVFVERKINKQMVGLRFGELLFTRKFFVFTKKVAKKSPGRRKKK